MKTKLALLSLSLALLAGSSPATAQGTALTYQGRLDTSAGTANGMYDFQFIVHDALTGGSPVGANPLSATLAVSNGLFTATLDPGAGVFTGPSRWLSIAVRTNGAALFATLSPRQPLTATPYAITAGGVSGSVSASQLTGTIPIAQLPAAVVTNGAGGVSVSGTFSGNGAGLTSLPPNVALRDAVQTFSGENTFDQIVNINGWLNLRSELTIAQPVPGVEGGELLLLDAGVMAPVGNTSWVIDNFGAVSNASLRFHRNGIVGLSLAETSLSYGGALYADLATRQVGIGSTAPMGKLEIQSGANADGSGDQVAIALGWRQGGYRHFIRTRHNAAGVRDNAIDFFVNTATTPEASSAPGISNQLVMSLNGGNVGIGTASPTAKLHVNGDIVAGRFSSEAGEILLRGAGGFNNPDWTIENASDQLRFSTGGVVKFAVNGSGIVTASGYFSAPSATIPALNGNVSFFGNVTVGGDVGLNGNTYVDRNFSVKSNATVNGNATVIGNATVNGEMTARVVTITGGSDVAEPYHVAAAGDIKPVPGMVVAIDSEQIGQMRVAARAYDKTVAGILSGANGISPGITLRQTGTVADGALPVASIGRVWCYCDADANGPIEAGDMLTTSDTAGHAMRVGDFVRADGSVIGKAMSPLKSGRGLVLVLVSLK